MGKCKDCQWWERDDARDSGFCWRYPPRPVGTVYSEHGEYSDELIVKSVVDDYLPATGADDFCGEFMKRKADLRR